MRIRAFAIGLALAWATIGGAHATDVVFTIIGGGTTTTCRGHSARSVFDVPSARSCRRPPTGRRWSRWRSGLAKRTERRQVGLEPAAIRWMQE